GLLEDDGEWERCLREASTFKMPGQLRRLFAQNMVHCRPANPAALWNTFLPPLTEDLRRRHQSQSEDAALRMLSAMLCSMGSRLDDAAPISSSDDQDLDTSTTCPHLTPTPELAMLILC